MNQLSTRDVLKILGTGAVVLSAIAIPALPFALIKTQRLFKQASRRELGLIIRRLQKQEMISINQKDSKTQITITDKGRKRLLEYDFEKIKLKAKKRDGKWRLIIFDIPEYQKNARDVFRKKILQLGFKRIQDSVFISAFPCRPEVDFLAHYLGISDFVSIAIIDRFEKGEELIFKNF